MPRGMGMLGVNWAITLTYLSVKYTLTDNKSCGLYFKDLNLVWTSEFKDVDISTDWIVGWQKHELIDWLINWLIDWLTDLNYLFIDWLIDWLTDNFKYLPTYSIWENNKWWYLS